MFKVLSIIISCVLCFLIKIQYTHILIKEDKVYPKSTLLIRIYNLFVNNKVLFKLINNIHPVVYTLLLGVSIYAIVFSFLA